MKKGTNRTMKVKMLCENKGICLAPLIKIVWEEQLVDPPIDYITSVNAVIFSIELTTK